MKGMKKHWPIYILFAVLGAAALSCSLVDICPVFETIHPAIKINKTAFAWTTGIGILPMTIIMVVMGSSIHVLLWWAWLTVLLVVVGMAAGAKTLQKNTGKHNLP